MFLITVGRCEDFSLSWYMKNLDRVLIDRYIYIYVYSTQDTSGRFSEPETKQIIISLHFLVIAVDGNIS